ncbi:MAG TPA: NifU family protein [Thermoleophilaceae bacterium]|jgi:Fe/S biogenesis protein NfuA
MAEQIIHLTEKAREKVEGFRAGVEDADAQAMWVEVTGVHRGEFTYNLSLKPAASAGPDASLLRFGSLPVVVPGQDVEILRGAEIDWSDDLMAGGLMVRNPNRPSIEVGDAAPEGLSGDVATRVAQVIDRQINPAIAQHGGMARLERVEGDTVFVRLGGGCQGCGMATVTLDQGIESAILQAVPEIRRVVDVTDHESGENPYFQPAPA